MAEALELSKLDNLALPTALSQSRSPRAARGALQLNTAEHKVLEKVVRKHIIRRRWYLLINIIILRLRQQKFGMCIVLRKLLDLIRCSSSADQDRCARQGCLVTAGVCEIMVHPPNVGVAEPTYQAHSAKVAKVDRFHTIGEQKECVSSLIGH